MTQTADRWKFEHCFLLQIRQIVSPCPHKRIKLRNCFSKVQRPLKETNLLKRIEPVNSKHRVDEQSEKVCLKAAVTIKVVFKLWDFPPIKSRSIRIRPVSQFCVNIGRTSRDNCCHVLNLGYCKYCRNRLLAQRWCWFWEVYHADSSRDDMMGPCNWAQFVWSPSFGARSRFGAEREVFLFLYLPVFVSLSMSFSSKELTSSLVI